MSKKLSESETRQEGEEMQNLVSQCKLSDQWRTPRQFYDRLDAEFHFGLDAACTSENRLAPEGICFDKGMDALGDINWAYLSRGKAIWLNCPYSDITPWLEKAYGTSRQDPLEYRSTVVCLLPADPSVGWWRDWVREKAAEIRFVIGRIPFEVPIGAPPDTPSSGAKKPSAVVIYRPGSIGTGYTYMNARE